MHRRISIAIIILLAAWGPPGSVRAAETAPRISDREIIGFALWDRRTMVRPFESKVKEIEEELSRNRQRLHALLEALRSLGQTDEKVAEVLRQFQLL